MENDDDGSGVNGDEEEEEEEEEEDEGKVQDVWAGVDDGMMMRRNFYLVGFLCAKLDIGGVHVAVTYSTHFH